MTSLEAAIIALEIFGGSCLSFKCTIAAAFLIMAIDLIRIGLTKKSPISKYFFDLWVDAPQYLSLGTFIDPIQNLWPRG